MKYIVIIINLLLISCSISETKEQKNEITLDSTNNQITTTEVRNNEEITQENNINIVDIEEVKLLCPYEKYELNTNEITKLIEGINTATQIIDDGKNYNLHRIDILFKNGSSKKIVFSGNRYKKKGAVTLIMQADFKMNFLSDLCFKPISSNMSIENFWNILTQVEGGCLTGSQYIRNGKIGGEGCVFTLNTNWDRFFKREPKELTNFLIHQLKDTSKTEIHTCPFFQATNGEVAVYCLQNIYKKNWFDFKEFYNYKNKEATDAIDNRQAWLQNILLEPKKRELLSKLWREEMQKKIKE